MVQKHDVMGTIIRIVMVVAIMAVGFSLAGCGEEMAKMEAKQLKLQSDANTNAGQIAALSEKVEQNQQELSAGLDEVRIEIRNVVANAAEVSKKQAKLLEEIQKGNRQTANQVAQLEQNQNELQTGIEDVKDNTRNVASDMAADITNIKDEQARLYETMQSNDQKFTNDVAVIEQNHQQWQGKVEELQQNFQEVTTRLSTLGDDLLKLQGILQDNVREMTNMMELSGKEQTKYQETIRNNLLVLDKSISAIKQNQQQLQSQIVAVRNSAEIMSNELPAAIEQLREEMEQNRSIDAQESQPPPETNSTE